MTFTISAPSGAIRLRTLGSLDLRTIDGQECETTLAQGKRMALLSYLTVALPHGFHRRDTLVGLFWPELDQRHARAALRQSLHFLRQTLGRDIVLNRGPEEIGIDFTKLHCDVLQFEQALECGETERAIDLYGGPFLKGFFIHNAPDFERWLSLERERLERRYADALRCVAEHAEAAGDLRTASTWWKKLAIHDPYSSEIACQLISALDASGDRAGAIAHGKTHTDAVRMDLEVEPSGQVLQLVDRLRSEPSNHPIPVIAKQIRPQSQTGASVTDFVADAKSEDSPRWTRMRYVAVVIVFLIASGSAVLGLPRSRNSPSPPTVTLAVLPFQNLGSPEFNYYVFGLAEDIVNRLAGVQNMTLVGPNDGGLDTPDDPEGFGRIAVDAQFILRGTVERVIEADGPGSVRLVPSLIRASDGAQIWTETIEREFHQVFDAQIRVAEQVVRLLGMEPLSTERAWLRTTLTNDPEAFDLYLLGNNHLRRASTSADDARAAVGFFEQAVGRDSGFVQAYAKLAIAHTSMYWWNHDRTPTRLTAARAAADRAVRLRPDIPNTHLALGWYYYWGEHDYDRALSHFELARTNWPGVCDVLALVAAIRRRQGDFQRSLENHYEAARNDPSCVTCYSGAAFTHLMLRDFAAAEQDFAKAVSIAPDFAYAHFVGAMTRLGGWGDTTGARQILGPPTSGAQIIRLSSTHSSAVPRILGGQYDSATASMTLDGEIADTAGYFLTKAELARRMDRGDEASAYYDSAQTFLTRMSVERRTDPQLHSRLGLAYAGLGWRDRAVREGTEATRLRPISADAVDGPLAVEMLARIYTLLGDEEAAIEMLEMLVAIPSHISRRSVELDPIWAPLRGNRRFQTLLR